MWCSMRTQRLTTSSSTITILQALQLVPASRHVLPDQRTPPPLRHRKTGLVHPSSHSPAAVHFSAASSTPPEPVRGVQQHPPCVRRTVLERGSCCQEKAPLHRRALKTVGPDNISSSAVICTQTQQPEWSDTMTASARIAESL